MMVHDFAQKLAFSNGANAQNDIARIRYALGEKCIMVEKTDIETDKTGIDYYAHLKMGAVVNVDAKRRESGASKWWKDEPELAIETLSVVYPRKIGWTFSTSSLVDYILYSFEPCDSNDYYFVPFQLLRKAAWENGKAWKERYSEKKQDSGGWQSTCIFVPASVVLSEIQKCMIYKAS
jgi:hypothetical protein